MDKRSDVCSADLDGDGDYDLATLNIMTGFEILMNNGDGTFSPGVSQGYLIFGLTICSADLDRDGDNDLAAAGPAGLSILMNFGDGTFSQTVYELSGNGAIDICAADFNDDGNLDIVTAYWNSDIVSISKNNGDGTFSPCVNYDVGDEPRSVFAADVDGDGDNDLAVANKLSDNISILKNNGDGAFTPFGGCSVGLEPQSVFLADMDGDGDNDMAVANGASDNVSILTNCGDGTFSPAVNCVAGNGPREVLLADYDGDEDLDLAVCNEYSNTISIMKNDGYGNIVSVNHYAGSGISISSADYNEDGDSDLASITGVWVSISINQGDGIFPMTDNYDVGNGPRSIFSADLDGDGDSDLAVANDSSDNISILKNNGDGTFTTSDFYQAGDGPCSIFSTDLDGDGDSDLAVANSSSDNISILKNNGDGTFAIPEFYQTGEYPISIFSADLDGDGDSDLAVANYDSDYITILKNNGDGVFAWFANYSAGINSRAIISADLDGDEDYDLAVGSCDMYGLYGVNIFMNNGDGTFATPVNYTNLIATSVCAYDFDGDLDNDLAVICAYSNIVTILTNNGEGTFSTAVYPDGYYPVLQPKSVISSDLDGDGNQDLVVDSWTQSVSVFRNNGDGSFVRVGIYGVDYSTNSICSTDFNGDGSYDLATANHGSDNVSILLNTTSGGITQWPDNPGPSITLRIEEEGGTGKVKSVILGSSLAMNGATILQEKMGVIDPVPVVDGFVHFPYNYVDREIRQLILLDQTELPANVIGHIGFKYTLQDYDAGNKIDAYVFFNDNTPPIGSNPLYDYYKNAGWEYYDVGEYPVSMLIPPNSTVASVDGGDDKPIIFVHGVAAVHNGCWEDMPDEVDPAEYDSWRFYYPYDQFLTESGKLLGSAINKILALQGLYGCPVYDEGTKISIIAHSMGGLISRSYIQSADYDSYNNIRKLLMFGTPNHGSFAAYKMFYRFWGPAELFDVFTIPDTRAPAYGLMSPGDDTLFWLNSLPPKGLGTGFPYLDYLVVAGTDDKTMLPHSEIEDQDDGVTSVSSASLLEWDIPLAFVNQDHLSMKVSANASEIVERFLDEDYEANSNPHPFDGLDDCYCFKTSFLPSDCTGENGVKDDIGILEVNIPFAASNVSRYMIEEIIPGTLVLWENKSAGLFQDDVYLQRNHSGSQNFFSISDRLFNFEDIGLRLDAGSYNVLVFRGEDHVGSITSGISFDHLQTTMTSLVLDPVAQLALNAPNSIILSPLTSSKILSPLAGLTYEFEVDAAIDTLTISLTSEIPGADFTSHDLVLTDPFGRIIDPSTAETDPLIEFNENIDYGPAQYQIIDPGIGTWQINHSTSVLFPRVGVYIYSSYYAKLSCSNQPYVMGDTIVCEVQVSGDDICIDSNMDLSAEVIPYESADPVNLGIIELFAIGNGLYQGFLPASYVGGYRLNLISNCEQLDAEMITRNAGLSIWVGLGEYTVSDVGDMSETPSHTMIQTIYPNPFNPTTTIRFDLSETVYVKLCVYNVKGELVSTIVDQRMEEGRKEVVWTAIDSRGKPISSGIYFCRLIAGDFVQTKKMVLLR